MYTWFSYFTLVILKQWLALPYLAENSCADSQSTGSAFNSGGYKLAKNPWLTDFTPDRDSEWHKSIFSQPLFISFTVFK